ncbi:hypothetical protein [Streptomyces sasae]|uniref:hypothetical protein n=1 Tax=Streptomyces sasae TaxID=1266772 RepID=UPI002931D32C|nr:hypothetical protein [Streptomyces sasae]
MTTFSRPSYAAAQRIGGRSHQCDAIAVASFESTTAYALLDGMGSTAQIAQWTEAAAIRLAETAARLGSADAALRQVHATAAAETGRGRTLAGDARCRRRRRRDGPLGRHSRSDRLVR